MKTARNTVYEIGPARRVVEPSAPALLRGSESPMSSEPR